MDVEHRNRAGGDPVLHAVVPAGGAGTRLWPLSRRAHPKFLVDLTGAGASMLQETARRLAPVSSTLTVVTGRVHEDAVRAQLADLPDTDIPAADVLPEPSPRDSMAAIGLAAAVLARRHGPDAVLGSFAADHVVADVPAFHEAVREAALAARGGDLVTLGIAPTHPATGFGYIEAGEPLRADGRARRAVRFTEKPDAATARAYLDAGGHWWNAGMFVTRADVLLGHLGRLHPDLARALTAIAQAWDTGPGPRAQALERHWDGLPRISIDHALAEPLAAEGEVAVVPVDMGWDDVGDVDSLAGHAPAATSADGEPLRVLGDPGRVTALASPGALVAADARRVVVLGIPGAVVLDTPDALLVTTREHAQGVKDAVDLLGRDGHADVL